MSHVSEPRTVEATTEPPVATANWLDQYVLAPAMESTAHGLDQHNPDPEPNSIFEFMGIEIRKLEESESKNRLTILLNQAIKSEAQQKGRTREISGDTDRGIAQMRDGRTVKEPNVHELAALVREPAKILVDTDSPAAAVKAAERHLDELIERFGKRLLSPSVGHNLGKAQFAVLVERVS